MNDSNNQNNNPNNYNNVNFSHNNIQNNPNNNSNNPYGGYQQIQQIDNSHQNTTNYNYPTLESINNQNDSFLNQNGSQLQNNNAQMNYFMGQQQQMPQYPPQQHYMEQPYMGNPYGGNENGINYNQNNGNQQNQIIYEAPPPPPMMQNGIKLDNQLGEVMLNQQDFEVRDIRSIEECKHTNSSKYLYISSPQMLLSTIVIVFYIFGIVSLVAGFIILLIVLVIALGKEGKGDCGDCKMNCGSVKCCSGCDLSNLILGCCRCTEICCLSYNPSPIYYSSSYGYDYYYYRSRYHRRQHYHDYELRKSTSNCVDGCFRVMSEICACSCCDTLSLGSSKDSCMINKVEVYCTECNSKLKEEYTGTQQIVPSLLLGIFGVIILIVSILLLQHYNVS